MYVIKEKPEDFIVEEIYKVDLDKKGNYSYFILEKKNWNTNDAIKAIASRLRVNEKYFNVAGIKDKQAITKQLVSVSKVSRDRLERLKIKDIQIQFVGYGKERLKLGQLFGNSFKIVVRNLDKKYDKINFIENYFDDQRFGGRNHLLGHSLVRKSYRQVCYMLRLKWEKGDYIGALRKLGKKLVRFYINSYQSWLWNRALVEYFKPRYKNFRQVEYSVGEFIFSNEQTQSIKFPIVGFLTEFDNKEIMEIYEKLMKKEKINKESFIFRDFPEISSEGNERDILIDLKDLKVKYVKDELHKSKLKAIVEFSLPAGSYATVVIKKMFS